MHATWPLLVALYHLGRWEEALAVADEHLAAFHRDPAVGCSFVRDGPVVGATMLAHRGELDRARELAAAVGDPTADLDTASAWQARFATASGDPATARRISAAKARERRIYGQQHLLALLEALAALEDWPAVAELLPQARARVEGNALLAPFCDRVEGLAHAQAGRRPRPRGRCAAPSAGSSGSARPSRWPGPASGWRRSSRPAPPGRCWRPPWRPTSGWPARRGSGPCGPGSARRPDRRGRGPRPTAPRSGG